MLLQDKSLEKLRLLINEETEYRSGPDLVDFFNKLGFHDSYGPGFPTRWEYTDDRLSHINGTPELDKCIKNLLAPINFIGRFDELDSYISEFNQYLAFDKWKVVRNDAEVFLAKADNIEFEDNSSKEEIKEDDFLKREFKEISLENLGFDGILTETLKFRLDEIRKCLTADAPLSVIFLAGSALEGILLGTASQYPQKFNQSKSSPKDKVGKVKPLQKWTLNNFIDVAYNIGLLAEDVKQFSHSLRDFRNYIHPYQQISSGFNPDIHTAKISWQVLKAAIYQIAKNKINLEIR